MRELQLKSSGADGPLLSVCAGNLWHYPIPGTLALRDGGKEAVVLHLHVRSQQRGNATIFRGFMFAMSLDRNWFSLDDGYVCQPDIPEDTWPGITLR